MVKLQYSGMKLKDLTTILNSFEPAFCNKFPAIAEYLEKLNISDGAYKINSENEFHLRKLVQGLTSKAPENFDEFLNFVRITVTFLLLKDGPISLILSKPKLLAHTFNCQISCWNSDVAKVCFNTEKRITFSM